jgi:hypothetical protein
MNIGFQNLSSIDAAHGALNKVETGESMVVCVRLGGQAPTNWLAEWSIMTAHRILFAQKRMEPLQLILV